MQTNVARTRPTTHEGAPAHIIDAEAQLRRSVMTCLLWETTFYEDGVEIAERIANLVQYVPGNVAQTIAIEARTVQNLRHAPLWIALAMVRHHPQYVEATLSNIILRADELAEFMSMYDLANRTKDGLKVANSVKRGLARAFPRFSEYQFAKYSGGNRDDKAWTIRDVMFICHPKPVDDKQAQVFKKIADGTLGSADTWEVARSAGSQTVEEKRENWERLISEGKLGGLAFLRNLRTMEAEGVDRDIITYGFANCNFSRVLPFRFIAASRYVPQYEPLLEDALLRNCKQVSKLIGRTAVLVDVSGSMCANLSSKSDMCRCDAAYGVAMIAREICDDVDFYSFASSTVPVPARRGFALRDALDRSQEHGWTDCGGAVKTTYNKGYDRVICITDEQSHSRVPDPPSGAKGYMINVAAYQNGVGYGAWHHIDGWSESVVKYICEVEAS